MSLAMTAASLEPFENNDAQSISHKKKIMQQHQSNNKTRKQVRPETMIDNDKVNSVLASIHKGFSDEDDEDTFTSMNPISAGLERPSVKNKIAKIEKMTNRMDMNDDTSVPSPLEQSEIDLQKLEINYMNDDQVRQYYKKIMPNYQEFVKSSKPVSVQHSNYSTDEHEPSNPVVNKLNYIINLLEENQDQRTNNVTEEVILYSFLGVFIIFVVDGFTRVGKYVR
jgi:hypothetical protein